MEEKVCITGFSNTMGKVTFEDMEYLGTALNLSRFKSVFSGLIMYFDNDTETLQTETGRILLHGANIH